MRIIKIILFILLSAVLAVSVWKIVQTTTLQQKEKEDFETLAELVIETTSDNETQPPEKEPDKQDEHKETVRNIAPVLKQNNECVGWIYIDGTNINYPVMHTPDNPQKYLRLNFNEKYSQSGVPFLDGRCSLNETNLIVFGHNMKNGTMFSDLKKYLDTAFREAHKTIEFETADGVCLFEVTDVIKTNTSNEWYNQINATDGRRLVLSTCYGSAKSGRLLIIAKEVYTYYG